MLSIMQNRLVRDQWEYLRKMERNFLIKPGQPIEMVLFILNHFPNFLIRAKNQFVKNVMANFSRNIPTEISGPPPKVIPNILVKRNWNRPFILIPTKISEIFGIMESTHYLQNTLWNVLSVSVPSVRKNLFFIGEW